MSEVLIYGGIESYTAETFIKNVNAVDGDELTVRIDTNGGDPQATFGMVAKLNEFKGKTTVKVDGRAYSSGFFFVAMANNVESLDVSEFMVHRAAYPEWVEKSTEYFTDSMKANLERINKSLRKSFESKIDVKAFEELKDVKIKEIFSMESRIDVFLTAKEAKKIGLINKINKLTPEMSASIDKKKFELAAFYEPKGENKKEDDQKSKKMTKEELLAKHPDLCASMIADGVTAEKEKATAKAEAVKIAKAELLADAKESGATAKADAIKTAKAEILADAEKKAKLETESTGSAKTGKVEVKAEKTELEKIEANIDGLLNIKA